MKKTNVFLGLYILVVISLFFYSYTQVDLSLTLSRISIYQTVEKYFQYIGYFQRPFSTALYTVLLILLFIFYGVFLVLANKNAISRKQLWTVVLITSIILAFSYNAFSYDLFNYIFDAKIITHYHQSPYIHKALDYPGDPMLSFMHSVHRIFPYGPVWLVLTVPLSFLGGNIFLVTFYLFKFLSAAAYVGCVYFIEKIIRILNKKQLSFSMIFFAFNPLVIIEGLVSSHNDIIMAFLAVGALYFLMQKKYLVSFSLLLVSIGIKYGSVLLAPLFLFFTFIQKISFQILINVSFFLIVISVIIISFASGQNKNPEIQPWYFLNLLPFAALASRYKVITIMSVFVSLGMLTIYIPFLYNGIWPQNIVSLKIWILSISVILGLIVYFLSLVKLKADDR